MVKRGSKLVEKTNSLIIYLLLAILVYLLYQVTNQSNYIIIKQKSCK